MKMRCFIVCLLLLVPILTSCGGDSASDSGALTDSVDSDSVTDTPAVDGAESDRYDVGGITGPEPTPDVGVTQPPQAGTLTAGDYDDQLNAHLYVDYLSDFFQKTDNISTTLPYLDVSQRVAIAVIDAEGKPYSGAKVHVLLDDQRILESVTPATGVVYTYASFDQLPERFQLRVSDRTEDTVVSQSLVLADVLASAAAGQSAQIRVSLPVLNQPATQLDLMLVIDATGSMSDELLYLQTELSSILASIHTNYANLLIRVGLVFYRDVGDDYVLRSFDFSRDMNQIHVDLNSQIASGGGDYPEAMDQALASALAMDWQPQSSKILLLVADAPPHMEKVDAAWASARQARAQQIHIVPVAASGVGTIAEFIMRGMAALTHSRYLFLTDDSGVGNPHAEPTVDCYVVTRLDSLIARVVSSLLSGERVEPESEQIIRSVGNYNAGVCEPGSATADGQ